MKTHIYIYMHTVHTCIHISIYVCMYIIVCARSRVCIYLEPCLQRYVTTIGEVGPCGGLQQLDKEVAAGQRQPAWLQS
jgi:hypothetical protein